MSELKLCQTPRECQHCKTLLPTRLFGANNARKDGLQVWCKPCRAKYASDNRHLNRARESKNRKSWRLKNSHKMVEYFRKYRAQDPQKVKCRQITRQAIKSGIIIRGKCETCHSERVQAHHDDYLKPFDVRWFCPLHHSHHHKQLRKVA